MKKPTPHTVEMVKSTNQPGKAELEEPIKIHPLGETVLNRMAVLTGAATERVKMRWIERTRRRNRA